MYNFFVLEQGDKWAKTGTRFKPRSAAGYPRPETVTASDMKKERSVSKSPAQGPVQVPTRAPEPKRAQQAQPQAKTTTHAIRLVSAGRNAQILGNRHSPPPPTPERARPDATTRAFDEDDAMQSHGRSRQQGELQLHQQEGGRARGVRRHSRGVLPLPISLSEAHGTQRPLSSPRSAPTRPGWSRPTPEARS